VLGHRTARLRLGVVIGEDRRWAGGRRRRMTGGSTGGVNERRSNGALQGRKRQMLDSSIAFLPRELLL